MPANIGATSIGRGAAIQRWADRGPLQQLVIARPKMVLPLEQIMKGVLANFFVHLEDQQRWRDDDMRSGRRAPLSRMPLSELRALKALPEANLPTSHGRSTRNIVSRGRCRGSAVKNQRVVDRE